MEAGLLRLRFPAQSQPGIQTAQRPRMFMRFLVIVVCTFAGLHRSLCICSCLVLCKRCGVQFEHLARPQLMPDTTRFGRRLMPSIVLEEDCWTCTRLQEDFLWILVPWGSLLCVRCMAGADQRSCSWCCGQSASAKAGRSMLYCIFLVIASADQKLNQWDQEKLWRVNIREQKRCRR